MTAEDFIAKWSKVDLTERSAAQAHFLDLCELVGHPKPQEADPKGEWFTFERGASKHGGGDGWADVWKRTSLAGNTKAGTKTSAPLMTSFSNTAPTSTTRRCWSCATWTSSAPT